MMTYNVGDVLYAPVTYVGGSRHKERPVLVLLDTGDLDLVIARITSRQPRDSYDIPLTDLASAGLPKNSTVRLSKLVTIPRAEIVKTLGKLGKQDRASIRDTLQAIADSWK